MIQVSTAGSFPFLESSCLGHAFPCVLPICRHDVQVRVSWRIPMMRKLGDVMPPASSPAPRERVRIIVVADPAAAGREE